jgi:predicted nucleic acid-binding protein
VSRVFVDTSALLVHLDGDDPRHRSVRDAFAAHARDEFVSHGYVVAESIAVARRRFGVEGAITVIDELLPLLEILPIEPAVHSAALAAYRASLPTGTSFVDQVSFQVIAHEGIAVAIVLDPDFHGTGVSIEPAQGLAS